MVNSISQKDPTDSLSTGRRSIVRCGCEPANRSCLSFDISSIQGEWDNSYQSLVLYFLLSIFVPYLIIIYLSDTSRFFSVSFLQEYENFCIERGIYVNQPTIQWKRLGACNAIMFSLALVMRSHFHSQSTRPLSRPRLRDTHDSHDLTIHD